MPFLGLRAWAGTVDEAKILQSQILGQVVSYSLYLPPGYRQHSRRYPVLYLLHGGADGQPADWFRMAGIDILLDRMIGDGLMPPCIAVAPDGRRPGGDPRATYFLDDADGSYGWRSMFLQEFIPQVEATHQAIGTMQMRALLGLSAAHVALDQAGILHRFRVSEGGHDWIFWQGAFPSAMEHVGRIFTRQYGE